MLVGQKIKSGLVENMNLSKQNLMKKISFWASFLLFFIIVSCNDDDNDNPFEPYLGAWSGTYKGGDTGSWTANIDNEGSISGFAVSDSLQNFPMDLTGSLSETGEFEAEAFLLSNQIEFSGQLVNDSAFGTWVNFSQEIAGNWFGEKD